MDENSVSRLKNDGLELPSARDLVALLFRRRKLLLAAFCLGALAAAYLVFSGPRYQAKLSILVNRERAEPIVSTDTSTAAKLDLSPITEEDINSEVELLRSEDLLRQVVLALNLEKSEPVGIFAKADGKNAEEIKIQRAVRSLARNLMVAPIEKTDMLAVSYRAANPHEAVKVLDLIARCYIAKNIAVHRPSGEFAFFDQQARQYQQRVRDAEDRLSDFNHANRVVDARDESSMALKRADEFHANRENLLVSRADLNQRLTRLLKLRETTPRRVAGGEKTADNPQLLQTMKTSLLNLENTESRMALRFQPDYPPLRDVRNEIQRTKAAIATQASTPMRENSTDRNPLADWIDAEIARTSTDLSAATASLAATNLTLSGYRRDAQQLLDSSVEQQNLERAVKVEEDNYLLYVNKREEARIDEALDRRGIVNVAIATPPYAGALPSPSLPSGMLVALLAGFATALISGFAAEYFDHRIYTPDQLENIFDVPVLAAVPAEAFDPSVDRSALEVA
jgi:uncharacterized protein involved in exopolysaccharide biosynthesis